MNRWILCVVFLLANGCATTHPIAWKTLPDFDVSYDRAWSVVIDTVTEKNIQLDVVEKDAGYIKSTQMDWQGKRFNLIVKFTSKTPVRLKLQVMGSVYDPWWGVWYQTGIPDLEGQLLQEIEGRLRNAG